MTGTFYLYRIKLVTIVYYHEGLLRILGLIRNQTFFATCQTNIFRADQMLWILRRFLILIHANQFLNLSIFRLFRGLRAGLDIQ
ncbi:hypothetical protein CWC00_24245 [Pseudoalteromonas rubra]|nr:hypothetical protein CWC00_24245 [Pseudoalteromonas rubra]